MIVSVISIIMAAMICVYLKKPRSCALGLWMAISVTLLGVMGVFVNVLSGLVFGAPTQLLSKLTFATIIGVALTWVLVIHNCRQKNENTSMVDSTNCEC